MKKNTIKHSRIILGEQFNVQLGKEHMLRVWNDHVRYCEYKGLDKGTFIAFIKANMLMFFVSQNKKMVEKIIKPRIQAYKRKIIMEYSEELGHDCSFIINRIIRSDDE
jgi:hypothetical protein